MIQNNMIKVRLSRRKEKRRLDLNGPIATKVVCFSCLLKSLRSLYGKQCGSTLFASILNSSVMLGNYLQQTTSADNIFRCIFFLGALRVRGAKLFIVEKIC